MFANSLRRNGQSASTFWARLDPTRFLRRIYDPKTAQINEWNNAVKQPLTLGSDMVALISFEMIVQCCTQNSRQTTQAQVYWFYWIEKERKLPEWVLDVWTLYLDSVFLIMISFFFIFRTQRRVLFGLRTPGADRRVVVPTAALGLRAWGPVQAPTQ